MLRPNKGAPQHVHHTMAESLPSLWTQALTTPSSHTLSFHQAGHRYFTIYPLIGSHNTSIRHPPLIINKLSPSCLLFLLFLLLLLVDSTSSSFSSYATACCAYRPTFIRCLSINPPPPPPPRRRRRRRHDTTFTPFCPLIVTPQGKGGEDLNRRVD